MWCIPRVNAEYVARMGDVLDLYAEQPTSNEPVVSFDESLELHYVPKHASWLKMDVHRRARPREIGSRVLGSP